MWAMFIWLLMGLAAAFVASKKGRSVGGFFLLGILLGPLGILWAALARTDQAGIDAAQLKTGQSRKCPHCAEIVRVEAKKCRHCGESMV